MKIKTRAKQFLCGFLVTVILMAGIGGLMFVDLSADRYMPGRFGPLLSVQGLNAECLDFSVMGVQYHVQSGPYLRATAALYPYQGFLPGDLQIACNAAGVFFLILADGNQEAQALAP